MGLSRILIPARYIALLYAIRKDIRSTNNMRTPHISFTLLLLRYIKSFKNAQIRPLHIPQLRYSDAFFDKMADNMGFTQRFIPDNRNSN